jgi:nitrate reductase NapD
MDSRYQPPRERFSDRDSIRSEANKGEQHISSLVVMHRPDAMPVLRTFLESRPALTIAATGECRCVLLCETDNQRAIVDHIDALEALPGIINVSLIYHHVESNAELDKAAELQAPSRGTDV